MRGNKYMAVYRNLVVDIPKEHVTIERQSDGKPALVKYVLEAPYDREKGYATPKRTTIGHQCEDSLTTMHPTSQYANIFPSLWEAVSKEQIKPTIKRIGLYTTCQAINSKTGIKDTLNSVYGVDKANGIMDFAMYSIIHHTNDASAFTTKMRNELTYSKIPFSDSWYSQLFESGMTREQELQFKRKWAVHCSEIGISEVWLCIDGSNDDCQSTGVELAEKGYSKSGNSTNIVSFTYAITQDGKPVTYDIYRGGLVDAKALKSIIDFLYECEIRVKGVILDRGYCTSDVLKYLIEHKLSYVIMVKGKPQGYEEMLLECGKEIKMNSEYLIPQTFLFGCQKKVQLFKNYNRKDYLTLFFDFRNATDRIETLLKNMYKEMERLNLAIQKGEEPNIDGKYTDLLTIKKRNGLHVLINSAGLQASIDEKGLYSIVSSSQMPPKEVHELYTSRSSSETQYQVVKTQLGYGTLRVQCTSSVRARFMVGFIASIIRYEIEKASVNLDINTNQMVQELEKVEAQKINNVYTFTHTENTRLKSFFKALDFDVVKLIDDTIKFENNRLAGRVAAPRHRKPGPKKGSHRKQYDEQGNVIPRKPGVKQGTKRNDINQDGSPRQKPGVKQGTKRGMYKKDGSLRQKPGRKPKTTDSGEKLSDS